MFLDTPSLEVLPKRDPWLMRVRSNATASLRVFCFPYAGVGASAYFPWLYGANSSIEFIAVQPPGREDRIREKPLESIGAIVQGATESIKGYLDQPYCLFGHSMGALIAFETAKRLRTEGFASPVRLFVSARRAPHCPDRFFPLHHLRDAELLAELCQRWDGIPAAILREPELLKLLLPCLRADLTATEKYKHQEGEPLDCPISVFGGETDKSVKHDDLLAWAQHTSGDFQLRMFPGDHFFIRKYRQDVLQTMREDLLPYLGGL